MSDPKFDSRPPNIPVHTGNGNISNVEVPPDVSLDDPQLHAALIDHVSNLAPSLKQPTAAGALENQKSFKENAQQLWNKVENGKDRAEAGNFVRNDGSYSEPVRRPDQESGAGRIDFGQKPANVSAVVHTHPRTGGPSPQDIQTAKDNKMTVYVVDADGLHAVDPGGNVTRVYQSTGQLFDEGPKPKPVWVPRYRTDEHGNQIRIN